MDELMIRRRLSRIEERLARLEELVQPLGQRLPSAKPDEAVDAASAEPIVAVAPLPGLPPAIPAENPTSPEISEATPHAGVHVTPPPLPAAIKPSEPVKPRSRPHLSQMPAGQQRPASTLEQTIGLNWAGWMGAIVFIIGGGIGVHFAWQQGWFGHVSPGVRLWLIALVGLSLIGLGEWVYRRVNVLSAVGLFGSGIAVLFLTSCAGYSYFELYGSTAAFALMMLSTFVGAVVAARGRLVSVAVLAMVGGNLAPVLIRASHPQAPGLLIYTLMLQLICLLLCHWGGTPKWWTLRALSLATTSLWTTAALLVDPMRTGVILALVLVYFALHQFELLVSTVRSRIVGRLPGPTFSFLVTAVTTTAGLWLFQPQSTAIRTVWVAGLATAALGMLVSTGRYRLANPNLARLAVGFLIQTIALVVLLAPVALGGAWICVSWTVLAIALCVLARALDLPIVAGAAPVIWGLAVLDLIFWTIGLPFTPAHRTETALVLYAIAIPVYLVMSAGLCAGGHVMAALTAGSRLRGAGLAARALATASAVVLVSAMITAVPPAGATVGLIGYVWLMVLTQRWQKDTAGHELSMGVLLFVIAKWAAIDVISDRLSTTWRPGPQAPLLSPVVMIGVMLTASLGLLAWRQRKLAPEPTLAAVSRLLRDAAAMAAVFWFTGIVEIDRLARAFLGDGWGGVNTTDLESLAITSWTVSCAITVLLVDRRMARDWPALWQRWARAIGTVIALAAVKYLVVDSVLQLVLSETRPAILLLNGRGISGITVIAGLMVYRRLTGRPMLAEMASARFQAGALAVLSLLCLLSMQLHQAFEDGSARASNTMFAEQMGLSVLWSVFAISCVGCGFARRTAGLRYFGLGLFAVTLVKVVMLDLSQLAAGYRVLTFLGLGALLMGTSVLYGKVSPKLLAAPVAGGSENPPER